jgi:hypothetical protein
MGRRLSNTQKRVEMFCEFCVCEVLELVQYLEAGSGRAGVGPCWNRAPTARNIIARGKRERSERVAPGYVHPKGRRGLKGRNTTAVIPPFSGLARFFINVTRGDALRACPWLFYCAPSALTCLHPTRGDALGACPWLFYCAPSALTCLHPTNGWARGRRGAARCWLGFL